MCLLSVAWQVHPEFPLVFIGNRDEYHARPSAAADWWPDQPNILAGRDLEAGGSWLGINQVGRFAVVTNRPELQAPATGARSRGELIPAWLNPAAGESAVDALAERNSLYGGFSLLLADTDKLIRLSGGNGSRKLMRAELPAGITGLSNTAPSAPWPKLTWLNAQLGELLKQSRPSTTQLMELLLRDSPVPGAAGDDVSVLPFVTGEIYGTRSASVVTIDRSGECCFIERRFGPGGAPGGESSYRFQLGEDT